MSHLYNDLIQLLLYDNWCRYVQNVVIRKTACIGHTVSITYWLMRWSFPMAPANIFLQFHITYFVLLKLSEAVSFHNQCIFNVIIDLKDTVNAVRRNWAKFKQLCFAIILKVNQSRAPVSNFTTMFHMYANWENMAWKLVSSALRWLSSRSNSESWTE